MSDGSAARSGAVLEWFYRLSLAAKGVLGALQLAGGLGLLLFPSGSVQRFVDWLVRTELAEDPLDVISRHIHAWATHLEASAERFYAIYLLGHGCLNLGVVVALLIRLRGAYHVSLAVLAGFVAYQLLRYVWAPDPMLLVLTAIDLFVIVLVILERRRTRPGMQ